MMRIAKGPLAILRMLLPANWSADGDSQERSRVFQLQTLLAALQVDSAVQITQ